MFLVAAYGMIKAIQNSARQEIFCKTLEKLQDSFGNESSFPSI
jgi:hypothetical protein